MQLFPNMRLALLVTVVTVAAGCTSVADMVGYDTETLNESAAKSYLQVLRQAQSKQVLDTSSQTSRRITAVFNRLKPYAERENRTGVPFRWQMNVIRSNDLNAWAMPGGKMVMYTGMVDRLHLSDDEIAAVIGHEMTHALLEHSKKAIGGQVLTGLGGSRLASATGRAGLRFDCDQTFFPLSGKRSRCGRGKADGAGGLQSASGSNGMGQDEQGAGRYVCGVALFASDQRGAQAGNHTDVAGSDADISAQPQPLRRRGYLEAV